MSYVQRLEAWFQAEKLAGRAVDLKFGPVSDELQALYSTDPEAAKERLAETVFKIVTGRVETSPPEPFDDETLSPERRERVNARVKEALEPTTHEYGTDNHGRFIFCRVCKRRSYSAGDISNRYCGFCRQYHPIKGIET